jgi:hypothetical protein
MLQPTNEGGQRPRLQATSGYTRLLVLYGGRTANLDTAHMQGQAHIQVLALFHVSYTRYTIPDLNEGSAGTEKGACFISL